MAAQKERSLSLFDIGQELRSLQQRLEDELMATGGDITEGTVAADIETAIAGYEWKQKEKVDAYVGLIRNIQGDAAKVAAAIDLLEKRKQILDNQVERLKACAKAAMEAQGIMEARGIVHGGLRIQQNSATPVEILEANPDKWPDMFVRVKKEIDKRAVTDALKDGSSLVDGFARLGERGTHIRVI